jgi:hypothetical protein
VGRFQSVLTPSRPAHTVAQVLAGQPATWRPPISQPLSRQPRHSGEPWTGPGQALDSPGQARDSPGQALDSPGQASSGPHSRAAMCIRCLTEFSDANPPVDLGCGSHYSCGACKVRLGTGECPYCASSTPGHEDSHARLAAGKEQASLRAAQYVHICGHTWVDRPRSRAGASATDQSRDRHHSQRNGVPLFPLLVSIR